MKFIKEFETSKGIDLIGDEDKRYYWLIPTDNRLNSALDKIGCTNPQLYKINYESKYVYIGSNNGDWGWTDYDEEQYLIGAGYKYVGAVNIPRYELAANKYNL